MRVHVAGGAGSGKSTFARILSEELSAPLLHLDLGGYDRQAERVLAEQREQLLLDCASLPAWVSEGTFVGWAQPFFEAADVVVFLDVPAWVAYKRIVLRHVRASARRQNPYKGIRRVMRFLQATRAWYASSCTRDELYRVPEGTTGITHLSDAWSTLRRYGPKVIVCRSSGDLVRMRNSLTTETSSEAAG
jgi:adenylate kinase family enzyme